MNDWAFSLQLGVVLVVILAIAVSTIGFAFRSIRAGVEPSIEASFRKLQAGWFQLPCFHRQPGALPPRR